MKDEKSGIEYVVTRSFARRSAETRAQHVPAWLRNCQRLSIALAMGVMSATLIAYALAALGMIQYPDRLPEMIIDALVQSINN